MRHPALALGSWGLLGLALAYLSLAPAGTPTVAAAGPLDDIVPPALYNQAVREGLVRVIVEVSPPAAPFLPEGILTTTAAVLGQRADIARLQSQVLSRLQSTAHRTMRRYRTVPYLALEVSPDALNVLQTSSFFVKRVFEDKVVLPGLAQSVPLVQAPAAWDLGFDGSGMTVAIIDTGVRSTHGFLAGKVVEEACYTSNVSGQSTATCPNGTDTQIGPGSAAPCPISGCDHGTHVAGIAAGNGTPAGQPFSGVAKGAQIIAIQVFSRFTDPATCGIAVTACPAAWTADILAALERVYELRNTYSIAAANLSLGESGFSSPCDSQPYKPAIDNLRSVDIATVVSAGNNGSSVSLSSPACISSAVSVGATTKSDTVASYSNVASFMSLFAPGDSILSSVPGGYGTKSGTSMAAPHVTGAWAVLKQFVPDASVDEVLGALRQTGVPISRNAVTKPRIRLAAALAALDPDAPKVSSLSPSLGAPGATLDVTINGSQFQTGAVASFGTGVTVNNTAFTSATQLVANITIGPSAVGARDVTVTNPDARKGILAAGFTVGIPGEIIIDNGAPGTTASGSWCSSPGPSPYGGGSLYSCGLFSRDTYRWRPTIPATTPYDVYVWWTTETSRSTTAPFTVVHAAGSTTKNFNERTGGGQWVLHGRYTLKAGTTGYVETSDVNGQVAADAVRFVPVAAGPPPPPPPPDTTRPDTSIVTGPSGTIAQNSATFTWTGSDNVSTNLVYATRLEPLESDFSAFSSSTSRSFSNLANRDDYTFHVKALDEAGNEDATPATRSFAVRVSGPPPATEIIIDNGAAGTSSTGSWCTSAGGSFYGANSLYSCGFLITDTYRWTPTIPAAGAYDVYVRWTTGGNRSATAPFIVVHAAGSTTKTFDERAGGGVWVLHGRYTFTAGTAGYVQTNDSNGQACADAVRFVPVP